MLEEDRPNHQLPHPGSGKGQVEGQRREVHTKGAPGSTRRTEGKEARTLEGRRGGVPSRMAGSMLSMLVSATSIMLSSISRLGSWALRTGHTIKTWRKQDTRPETRGRHPGGEQPNEARDREEEHTKEQEKEESPPLPPFWPPVGDG